MCILQIPNERKRKQEVDTRTRLRTLRTKQTDKSNVSEENQEV